MTYYIIEEGQRHIRLLVKKDISTPPTCILSLNINDQTATFTVAPNDIPWPLITKMMDLKTKYILGIKTIVFAGDHTVISPYFIPNINAFLAVTQEHQRLTDSPRGSITKYDRLSAQQRDIVLPYITAPEGRTLRRCHATEAPLPEDFPDSGFVTLNLFFPNITSIIITGHDNIFNPMKSSGLPIAHITDMTVYGDRTTIGPMGYCGVKRFVFSGKEGTIKDSALSGTQLSILAIHPEAHITELGRPRGSSLVYLGPKEYCPPSSSRRRVLLCSSNDNTGSKNPEINTLKTSGLSPSEILALPRGMMIDVLSMFRLIAHQPTTRLYHERNLRLRKKLARNIDKSCMRMFSILNFTLVYKSTNDWVRYYLGLSLNKRHSSQQSKYARVWSIIIRTILPGGQINGQNAYAKLALMHRTHAHPTQGQPTEPITSAPAA